MYIDDYLWEGLYMMKALFDHGKGKEMLDSYANIEMDSDYIGDIVWQSIGYVFADTRQYFNEETEQEIWVFFDPVFQEFYSLCARYEQERHVEQKDNPFRRDMWRSLDCGLSFGSYDYDDRIYDNPNRKCRIVLMLGCEFACHYQVVPGLLDIYEAFVIQIQKLKEELGLAQANDAAAVEAEEWKKAA